MEMEECPESELPAYLRRLKEEGYALVGLEQTVTSKTLGKVEFPEKMALVLGKEKEGIPAKIIQMLDLCIEIPQFGIIRSLNVHVSGSILIWEYISLIVFLHCIALHCFVFLNFANKTALGQREIELCCLLETFGIPVFGPFTLVLRFIQIYSLTNVKAYSSSVFIHRCRKIQESVQNALLPRIKTIHDCSSTPRLYCLSLLVLEGYVLYLSG